MGEPHLRWLLFLFFVIVCKFVSGDGNIPTGLCERIFVNADPEYVGFVQLGGAYRLQPFTWSDFPVFKHEQHDVFLYLHRDTRQLLIGPEQGGQSGLGATTRAFSETSWIYRGSTPLRNVIDRWFYYDYVQQGNVYVDSNANLGPRCIPDDVRFRPCSSEEFAFNQVIRQDLSDGQFVYINLLSFYYQRMASVYRYSRPVFLRVGPGADTAAAYLFYSESFSGWVVGPDYNEDSVFMYVRTNVMRPEFITGTWSVYTGSRIRAMSGISLDCRGIPTNQTCAEHNPCRNNGTCHQKDSSVVVCNCGDYFTGQFCKKPLQPVCPSLQALSTTLTAIWDTRRVDGALATYFCPEGHSPSYYFAVCRGQKAGDTSLGEWIADGSCLKTTTPQMTTTTRSSWSGWSSWSNWNSWSSWDSWSSWNSWASWSDRNRGDSGGSRSEGKNGEPSGLWIFTLVFVLTVTLILPFVVYGVLKCKEEPDEPGGDTAVEMVTVRTPEPPQDQDQDAAGHVATVSSRLDGSNTPAKQTRKRSRRVRNVSLARILSITSFFSLWFFLPWPAVCFQTKCGLYSSSMVFLAIFGVFMMPFAYLFMLIESIRSREKNYLSKLGGAGTVGRLVSRMRQAQPIITWTAVCYHYETRTRTVYHTDGQGNMQSSQITYQEKVVTHQDFKTFVFNYWSDDSAEQIEGVGKLGVTRVRLGKTISPGDTETATVYTSQLEEFTERNEHFDTYMDVGVDMGVPGFKKRVAAFVDENTAPWWMKVRFFALATVLGLTWPYRWFFRARTGKTHYSIVKTFYLSRPAVGNVNPYDVVVGERSEREVRKSMAVANETAENSGSSDSEPETTIAVGVNGPCVHVAL